MLVLFQGASQGDLLPEFRSDRVDNRRCPTGFVVNLMTIKPRMLTIVPLALREPECTLISTSIKLDSLFLKHDCKVRFLAHHCRLQHSFAPSNSVLRPSVLAFAHCISNVLKCKMLMLARITSNSKYNILIESVQRIHAIYVTMFQRFSLFSLLSLGLQC